MLGALGGAALGGSYVLLNTPRSGRDNQLFIKNFVETTQTNIEDVTEKNENLQNALSNLNAEVEKLQAGFIPEVTSIADDFSNEVNVYMRRINDGVSEINSEVEDMNARIKARQESGE